MVDILERIFITIIDVLESFNFYNWIMKENLHIIDISLKHQFT